MQSPTTASRRALITNNPVLLWCDAETGLDWFAITGSKRGNHEFAGADSGCNDGRYASVLASPAAEAARPQKVVRAAGSATVFVTRDETGRTRTKIIVQKRSYLDGGTEIVPGQRHYRTTRIPT